ncbi:sulfatase-like hydrolase/transferase [Desulfuromonas sp. TF]|uniref:sulfatase-like hydrolase/transferase n=1 Tax=Desulfuromonas sp. TF TaxID=1232410 RepID=UPI00138ADB28|nr:sulfatase-like hydrolase/transferase [Desulfuromonas sp. TF]
MTRLVVYNIVATAFFLAESCFLFSYYLQNTGFNEAFFYHLRPDLVYAGLKEYLPVLILVIVCMLGSLFLFSSLLTRIDLSKGKISLLSLGLLFVGLFISPPARSFVAYIENLPPTAVDSSLSEIFPDLDSRDVTSRRTGSNRPNIVLIYAESLEQRFFDEKLFPGLLPELKKLREQSLDFTNVAQGVGAEWTIGGMVASQCGYPLTSSFDVKGNDLSLFDEFLPGTTCLGDLLKKDGYHLVFIGGSDSHFAGKEVFLRSHGYSEIIDRYVLEKTLADKNYVNGWGIFDDTVFDYAIRKFFKLSKENSPFLLTLLTLDNHNGFLSKSCEEPYASGKNKYLSSVHCSDQLIAGFVEQIRRSPYSDKTVIALVSDHLAISKKVKDVLEPSQMKKRLTFFINSPDGKSGVIENAGIHYDIAPTLLDFLGYEVQGQMGFGAPLTTGDGFLPSRFGEDKWRSQAPNLVAIGKDLWKNDLFLTRAGISLDSQNLFLSLGGRNFDLRSWGASDVPASLVYFFDPTSLKLLNINAYAFDEGLQKSTLSKELLKEKDKLALVISRAKNLPGFSDPTANPNQWVYFCGKPGSAPFSGGVITGDFHIPFDTIKELGASDLDNEMIRLRQNLINR